MANENKQFCPLTAITRSGVGNCPGARCAWWVSSPDGGGYCAIQILGAAEAAKQHEQNLP